MSIRIILVAFNGSESSVAALTYAASLASGDAHVTALLAHSAHEVVDRRGAWLPEAARRIIADAGEAIFAEIEARFETLKDTLGLGERLHFLRAAGRVDAVMSEIAGGFDIILVGQSRGEDVDGHVTIHPDRIALLPGRPVLIVPQGYSAEACHSHAVLAWDGSRSAARAMSDGLALLEAQGRVTVLTIGEDKLPRPAEEVLVHLERHGVRATRERIAFRPGPAAPSSPIAANTTPASWSWVPMSIRNSARISSVALPPGCCAKPRSRFFFRIEVTHAQQKTGPRQHPYRLSGSRGGAQGAERRAARARQRRGQARR